MKWALRLLVVVGIALALPAAAHVLVTDGSVGTVLHVSPDDNPIVGQPTSFFFEFKDKANTFAREFCHCAFVIKRHGQVLFTQPLSTSNSFTFPERDLYQVQVIGQPLLGQTFEPFTLTYDIRVARQATTTASPNWLSLHSFHLISTVVITIFAGVMIIRERLPARSSLG